MVTHWVPGGSGQWWGCPGLWGSQFSLFSSSSGPGSHLRFLTARFYRPCSVCCYAPTGASGAPGWPGAHDLQGQ